MNTAARANLAKIIASGTGGWFQFQCAQGLDPLVGETAAQLAVGQILNAQGKYVVEKSALPTNWGKSPKRVDLALKGKSSGAKGWYGAVEIKWPGKSFDSNQLRLSSIQDVLRLATIDTANLNARFFKLGGTVNDMEKLFDKAHPQSAPAENGCKLFVRMLPRQTGLERKVPRRDFLNAFPESEKRLLAKERGKVAKVVTRLMAFQKVQIANREVRSVYVWQINK